MDKSSLVEVAAETCFQLGVAKVVQIGPSPVAILRTALGWAAFEDYCPHRAGPLSEGELEQSVITCPWHGARFDVTTGQCLRGPCKGALRLFQVEVHGGMVCVRM